MSLRGVPAPSAWLAAVWIAALAWSMVLARRGHLAGSILVIVLATGLFARSLLAAYDALRRGVLELEASSEAEESPADRADADPLDVVERVGERLRGALGKVESERDDLLAVLESTGDGIVVLGTHMRIELVNAAARRLLELTVDAPGRALPEASAVVSAGSGLYKYAESLLRGEHPPAQRIDIERGTGVTALLLSGNLVPTRDLRRRAVLVLHDLTDLRHLERVRTDFVANVSHEMRSPLASILGYAETLSEDLGPDDERFADSLERILRNARRLDDIIRDLIQLSRLENATAPQLSGQDVRKMVNGVVEQFVDPAREKELELRVELGLLPAELQLDPDLARQSLVNLVDNAVKYTPRAGRVVVRGWLEGEDLVLSVSNTGPGIPPEHQARIFERFYRVDTARSRAVGGTGLGLAIAKHAAALHGGSVRLRQSNAEDTTFDLVLPVHTRKPKAKA